MEYVGTVRVGEFGEGRTSFQVGMADKSSSSVDVYLLGGPVPVPERRQMLLPDSGRQNFEAGHLLEQTQHHVIELGTCQIRPVHTMTRIRTFGGCHSIHLSYGRDVLICGRILPDSRPGCPPGGRDLGRLRLAL